MNRVRIVGINHKTAPVEVREALAVGERELPEALAAVAGDAGPGREAVLLSTCNRVELYSVDCGGRGFDALCEFRGTDANQLRPHIYEYHGRDAVRHLYRVAASLDSMVPGETQIVGQVRRAYEISRQSGFAGKRLHGLFQRAMVVGREVVSETGLAAGRYSVAGVAADYATRVLGLLGGLRLLCVGTGKMVRLVLEHLHARGPGERPGSLVALGRDVEKAERFATTFGGRGGATGDLAAELADADLVVCGTGSREPVITADVVRRAMRGRENRPLFLVDIAVPRDVDPAVESIAGVHAYGLDDLQRAVEQTVEGRRGEITSAEAIVEAHVARYVAWHDARQLGPTIDKLYRRTHSTAAAEVERALRKAPADLSPAQREQVETMTNELARRLVNKMLHGPVSALRQAPGSDRHAAYKHAVEKLFSLE